MRQWSAWEYLKHCQHLMCFVLLHHVQLRNVTYLFIYVVYICILYRLIYHYNPHFGRVILFWGLKDWYICPLPRCKILSRKMTNDCAGKGAENVLQNAPQVRTESTQLGISAEHSSAICDRLDISSLWMWLIGYWVRWPIWEVQDLTFLTQSWVWKLPSRCMFI
jgi:hypothetical protein